MKKYMHMQTLHKLCDTNDVLKSGGGWIVPCLPSYNIIGPIFVGYLLLVCRSQFISPYVSSVDLHVYPS